MKVSDIMTLGAATVGHDAPLSRAVQIMIDHRISAVPVLDDNGKLAGIVAEGDFFREGGLGADLQALLTMDDSRRSAVLDTRKVAEIMTPDPVTIGPDASLKEAVDLMASRALKRLPVVSDGRVLGLISRTDLLQMLIK